MNANIASSVLDFIIMSTSVEGFEFCWGFPTPDNIVNAVSSLCYLSLFRVGVAESYSTWHYQTSLHIWRGEQALDEIHERGADICRVFARIWTAVLWDCKPSSQLSCLILAAFSQESGVSCRFIRLYRNHRAKKRAIFKRALYLEGSATIFTAAFYI